MSWTTADLLAEVKLRAFWPDSNAPLTDAEILRLAQSELQSDVFPLLLRQRGDFAIHDLDYSITSGTALYRVPKRAHAGRLKDVLHVDSNGREVSLPWVDIEELGHIYTEGGVEQHVDLLHYIKGDSVGLYPSPTRTQGTLRLRYYIRPGKLVTEAASAQITSTGATTLTCSGGLPAAWTTSNTFDVISDTGSFRTIGLDLSASSLTSTAMTLSSTMPDGIEVGDWIALAGESPIPQVPEAMHPYLYQRTAMMCLRSAGDREGFQDAAAMIGDVRRAMDELMSPRSDAESKIINPRYAPIRAGERGRWTR